MRVVGATAPTFTVSVEGAFIAGRAPPDLRLAQILFRQISSLPGKDALAYRLRHVRMKNPHTRDENDSWSGLSILAAAAKQLGPV